MFKKGLLLVLIGTLLLIPVILSGCGWGKSDGKNPSSADQREIKAGFYERQDSQGGVAVAVTWVTPEYMRATGRKLTPELERDLAGNLVFEVALTTHSGDLTDFDFAGAAQLKVNGSDAGKGSWQFISRDPHHPEGLLRFRFPVNERIKELRLTINNLRGVPAREFQWKL